MFQHRIARGSDLIHCNVVRRAFGIERLINVAEQLLGQLLLVDAGAVFQDHVVEVPEVLLERVALFQIKTPSHQIDEGSILRPDFSLGPRLNAGGKVCRQAHLVFAEAGGRGFGSLWAAKHGGSNLGISWDETG